MGSLYVRKSGMGPIYRGVWPGICIKRESGFGSISLFGRSGVWPVSILGSADRGHMY